MNLDTVIRKASETFKEHNISSYQLDAELILSDIMGVQREYLITNDKVSLSDKIIDKYNIAIKRRIRNEPVAYIIGKKEFWSHTFLVNKSTLIPRPETELLVYKLVKYFKSKKINILDIGTGTGCILLSLLKELNLSKGVGIDISSKALKVAKLNSKRLNLLNRSEFKLFDINSFKIGKYDLIVSNPPYIPLKDIKNLSKEILNFEPRNQVRCVFALFFIADFDCGVKILILGFDKQFSKNQILPKTNRLFVVTKTKIFI